MKPLSAIGRFSGAALCALALSGCAATTEALKSLENLDARAALKALAQPSQPDTAVAAQPSPPPSPPEGAAQEAFGVYAQVTLHEEGAAARRFFALWRRGAATDGAGGMVDEVEVKNPLGGTEARLRVDQSGALLEYRGKKIREGSGAELAARAFGRELPVRALGFWMRGAPDPDAPAQVAKNIAGRAAEIRQHGWVVEYIEHDKDELPKVMEMTADGLRVRVSVRRWLS